MRLLYKIHVVTPGTSYRSTALLHIFRSRNNFQRMAGLTCVTEHKVINSKQCITRSGAVCTGNILETTEGVRSVDGIGVYVHAFVGAHCSPPPPRLGCTLYSKVFLACRWPRFSYEATRM